VCDKRYKTDVILYTRSHIDQNKWVDWSLYIFNMFIDSCISTCQWSVGCVGWSMV